MNKHEQMGFATRQIHVGKQENAAGALCAPIYQTSTFEFATVEQGGARFAGQEQGYIYTRLGNPTVAAVEAKLASLEGGEDAVAAASGMGAISSALWSAVVAGDEIVAEPVIKGIAISVKGGDDPLLSEKIKSLICAAYDINDSMIYVCGK